MVFLVNKSRAVKLYGEKFFWEIFQEGGGVILGNFVWENEDEKFVRAIFKEKAREKNYSWDIFQGKAIEKIILEQFFEKTQGKSFL